MLNFIEQLHFTSDSWTFLTPFLMMVLDFLTGLVYAWGSKTFESSIMRKGLTSKSGEVVVLAVAELFVVGLGLPKYFLAAAALYIVFMELMSIMENLDKMGVPVPKFIKKVINNTNDVLTNADLTEINKRATELQDEIDNIKNDKES